MFMTNINAKEYKVIGLMSGTSLDGVDLAFCRFFVDNNKWNYEIVHAQTIEYTSHWKNRLSSLEEENAMVFQQVNTDYGLYLGQLLSDFIVKNNIKADFVSSHGHTIFHQPESKLTVQIGSGAAISANCKLPVVCDFRTLDVALGGQGAPLVPIGDKLLFSEYDYCLNLGGFANISFEEQGKRIAYDICPVNIVMNAITEKTGLAYDDKGEKARSGMLSAYILNELNQLPYFKKVPNSPKSLGKEWVLENVFPLFSQYEIADNDLLNTYCEHIAYQISKAIKQTKAKVLVTGGGVYNDFLMERIKTTVLAEIVVPDKKVIEFKEA
ncbi:MAG: anhydro-N-acetylmuramic acid kinase, partial [Bacteroidia bacterium]|nr:anhydro-N-acetylmuramic acid kinase [Bacteroidia bacterium]